MNKMHSYELKRIFRRVAVRGSIEVPKEDILWAFGQGKWSISIERELKERWPTFLDENDFGSIGLALDHMPSDMYLLRVTNVKTTEISGSTHNDG